MEEHITLRCNVPPSLSLSIRNSFSHSSNCSPEKLPIPEIGTTEEFLRMKELLKKTIEFTKSFSDYLHYTKTNHISDEVEPIPIDTIDSHTIKIKQDSPFLVYKETCKANYRRLLAIMKNLYKTAMIIPDVDKVIHTIEYDFNLKNHVYLKNPEFVFDNYIYYVHSYNHIVDSFSMALNILDVFEYLFYKTTNYYAEQKYDSLLS